mmetsp:Transcript_23603/g.49832  ORF Transcript_23603/g.49832 Transcript_23603/m.49832 type:complete len:235 (-) Transcript_23603:308-1012(-)|eukprot:CAMPEP_0171373814 /NCGR_PEP_ID=MMETSP0879-20121228/13476_1 /TAXON_ID=67004 /ORGANISM="Thalassiosira weissflogii, Strain CCMP1336" /LENGTH=234 /DNA_ID=CAMNT_0011883019 /DNA_START=119 /DNA_END=823 /DNA_ORIENTATION=-
MALTGDIDDSSSEGSIEIHQRTKGVGAKIEKLLPQNQEPEIELSGFSAEDENDQKLGLTEVLNHHGEQDQQENDVANATPSPQLGAGLLATLAGLLLGGPILGALAGASAAYVATKDEGPVGNAARASGEWAVSTGAKVGEAAKEANERHGIIDRLKEAFSSGWGRVRQFDEEHRTSERAKETLSEISERTVEFEKKHHVVENVLEGIQNGVKFLLNKLRGVTGENSNDGNGRN